MEDIFSVTENEINGGEYSNTISYRLMPCRTVFLEFESEEPFVSEKSMKAKRITRFYKDLLSSALVNGNVYEFSDINYIDRVDYDGSGNMKISAQKIHRGMGKFYCL